MDVDRPRELSMEALGVLREGIGLVFSQWWALQMAVQNEWGGPDSHSKADQLASDTVSWFTQSRGTLKYENLVLTMRIFRTKSYIICTENENCVQMPLFVALD
jgi:hypothetical protein